MPFAVTPDGERQLAEQQYLEAQAALLKRNGGDRPAGGTPVHAMADGAADFHDGERRERAARATDASDHADVGDDGEDETAEKTARHPQTGQFSAESEHSPFGLQRPYVQPGHAAESPSNAAGPRVAPVPNVGERTGYQPMVEAISNHGVPRTQVSYGPVGHEAPSAPTELTSTRPAGTLGGSLADNPSRMSVQHLDYRRGAAPVQVNAYPIRPDFHCAPAGSTPPAPRGTGPAAPMPPGA